MTVSVTDTDATLATLAVDTAELENGDQVTSTGVTFDGDPDAATVLYVRVESAGVAALYTTYAYALAGGATGRLVPSADDQTGSLTTFATNWIVPTGADVRKVINTRAQAEGNENLADSTVDGAALIPEEANRRDELVNVVVREIRAAIRKGGAIPLSLTAGSIPPEAEIHALNLAAYRLAASTPGLSRSLLIGDGERKPPLERMYDEAVFYVYGDRSNPRIRPGLTGGANCTPPTDPTGRDYATPVSDENEAVSAVRVGSAGEVDEVDLTTYGPAATNT